MLHAFKLFFITLSICLLTACGGGSSSSDNQDTVDMTDGETGGTTDGDTADTSDDDTDNSAGGDTGGSNGDDTSGGDNGNSTANIQPITPLTSTASASFMGNTITGSAGSSGDINAGIETTQVGSPELKLSLTNASMNVVDLKRTLAINATCENGLEANGVLRTDYLTGIETGSVSSNDSSAIETLSCSSTYDVVLPTTIASEESIITLLIEYGEDDPVSTTCPDDTDAEDVIEQPDNVSCDITFLYNYVITDDSGTKHLISTKQEFSTSQ